MIKSRRIRWLLATGVIVIILGLAFRPYLQRAARYAWNRYKGKATVSSRLQQYGERARARWEPFFTKAGVVYPPGEVVLVGLKEELELQVYAGDPGAPRHIRTMPVLKSSGILGPKLQQGDGQVPERLYRIESLNPNSAFHLSLRVNYPNQFDREQGERDGRDALGSDIMIHGSAVSIGCLAMGDDGAEDLFILAAETGVDNIRVVLSPVDFRVRELPEGLDLPAWTAQLYDSIRTELQKLPAPDDGVTTRVVASVMVE